ncbi:MAG TPA: rhodanese-like domain-containing protein [Xanthomonadaceae bacterium]
METLLHLVATYGLLVVFINVLVDQGGLPLPAYPAMVVTAALAIDRGSAVWPIVPVAMAAALIADLLWFRGGRRFGVRLLRLMCRISLSPDSCVLTTRGMFARWGVPSLMVAKFVPGFAAIATVLAGEARTRLRTFLLFDAIGALLWSGVAVTLGAVFHHAVRDVLGTIEAFGRLGLPLVIAAITGFVAWKAWTRRRFLRALRMARISPVELYAMIEASAAPVVLDVRSPARREATGWIPGAIRVTTLDEARDFSASEVIVYCDCPNEASAAVLAHELRRLGFTRVRPLAGGFEGWRAAGHPVDFADAAAIAH